MARRRSGPGRTRNRRGSSQTARSGRRSLVTKGPRGDKRPADVIGNTVHVMRIATGEIDEGAPVDDGKDKAAQALGRKGGAARAAKLTAERRAEIARMGATKRWGSK